MRTIEAFNKVYDKSARDVKEYKNTLEILEHDKVATFHKLTIQNVDSEMYLCDTCLIAGQKDTTENVSNFFKDSNCDGVVFVYGEKGGEHLVFAELKSTYSCSELHKAFNQVFHSFFKYHRLLSMCKNYDLASTTLDFVLACHSPKVENKAEVYSDIVSKQMLNSEDTVKTFDADILPELEESKTNSYTIQMGKIKIMNKVPLNDVLVNKMCTIHLVTSSTPSDDNATIQFVY